MKKIFTKPGFEVIFSLALIVIMALPPFVLAQTHKSFTVEINNGDTVINGKNIKKLNAKERREALAELDNIGTPIPPLTYDRNTVATTRRGGMDSIRRIIRLKRLTGNDSVYAFDQRIENGGGSPNTPQIPPTPPVIRFNGRATFSDGPRRNYRFRNSDAQSFNFSTTDDSGYATTLNINVENASPYEAKDIAATEKLDLKLNDLTFSPEFSTGKILISFNLPAKTAASVKLTSRSGEVLLTDKIVAGSYTKKISLPVNGVYFLQVNQGSNKAVKRIIKE